MKKNGFTLVELLAVIVIIGLLSSITLTRVNKFSSERKKQDYNNMVKLVEKNTSMLVSSDDDIYKKVTDKLTDINPKCSISYQTLIDKDLVDARERNPITDDYINHNSYVIVSVDDDNGELKYKFVNIDEEKNTEQPVSCLE